MLSKLKLILFLFLLLVILSVFYFVVKKNKSDDKIHFYSYNIINTYPHDPTAFTQGLVYDTGNMYEGTGRYGRSTLRRVDVKTGKILKCTSLPDKYFGEGITLYGNNIIQLTYKSKTGFVYDKAGFHLLKTFQYPREGWGITHNGKYLILSDGSATLHFLDPETFEKRFQVIVHDGKRPIMNLNELEYIKGEIFANIWKSNRIARIEPETGNVTGWIDLTGILNHRDSNQPVDVLNGIAYDEKNDRLFVTGKLWPFLFEIRLVQE